MREEQLLPAVEFQLLKVEVMRVLENHYEAKTCINVIGKLTDGC